LGEREGGRRKGEYGEKGEEGGDREWEEEGEERTGIYIVLMRIIEARYECLCYGTSTVCVTHVQYTTLTHLQCTENNTLTAVNRIQRFSITTA